MIKVFLCLGFLFVFVNGASIPPSQETQFSFISLIDDIEQAPFFPSLPEHEKVITFELLAAAETGNLNALLDRLGYIKLFTYLDHLSKDYTHKFISYSIPFLKKELEI